VTLAGGEDRARVGVVHGRFQPLHLGHLEYLLAAQRLCQTLVVGITSPDPWLRGSEPTNSVRGEPEANPFTFYERYLMVQRSLRGAGVDPAATQIVPFPHSYPERLCHYAPIDALYFLTIYDAWGEAKLQRFQDLGLRTRVLWRRDWRLTSGTEVRALIRGGGPWQPLLPDAVVPVIESHGALAEADPAPDARAGAQQ
jgi:cytidyltransferase-like protein